MRDEVVAAARSVRPWRTTMVATLLAGLLTVQSAVAGAATLGSRQHAARTLESGQHAGAEIRAGQRQSYSLRLGADDLARCHVMTSGVALTAVIHGPDGQEVRR